jgi:nicotinate-nucleotide adenylyltransferase
MLTTHMRIGFFGGSFDPPHLGHLAIARAAAHAFALDRILFAPTGHQPLKPTGATASFDDRLAMVSLLCAKLPSSPASNPQLQPSSLDAPLPKNAPNYTVDTLQRLRSTLTPADTLFTLVGLDAFLDLPRWRSPHTLIKLADWIVIARPGLDPAHLAPALAPLAFTPAELTRIHLLPGLAEPASATQIRSLLAQGSDCAGLLPESILTYIRAHHLYTP